MVAIVDTVIALRIIYLLVTPFEKWPAFKEGIIDENGSILKKGSKSSDWTMLHKLVARIKTIIGAIPGGKSLIGSAIATYALIREDVDCNNIILEDLFEYQYSLITEEEVNNMTMLAEGLNLEDVGVASVGGGVAPSANGEVEPVVKKKSQKTWVTPNKMTPGQKLSFREFIENK